MLFLKIHMRWIMSYMMEWGMSKPIKFIMNSNKEVNKIKIKW